jgi:hypothetical protein
VIRDLAVDFALTALFFAAFLIAPATGPARLLVIAAMLMTGIVRGFRRWQLRADVGRQAAADAAIRLTGLLGRGTIQTVRDTGRFDGRRHAVSLEVEVLLPRRRRFVTTIAAWVGEPDRARLRPGATIPVVANRLQPGQVVLDLEQFVVNDEAIAALGPIAGGPGGPVSRSSSAEPERDR